MASEFAFPLARNARIYAQLSKKRRKTQHFGNGWGQKWIHTKTRIRMIADKDGYRKIAYRIKSLGRKLVNFGNALEFLFFDERTDWTASAWEVPTYWRRRRQRAGQWSPGYTFHNRSNQRPPTMTMRKTPTTELWKIHLLCRPTMADDGNVPIPRN